MDGPAADVVASFTGGTAPEPPAELAPLAVAR